MIAEPFGPVVPAVPLPGAPLVFVVAQARFERIASIVAEEFIAAFQEAIRGSYPRCGVSSRPPCSLAQMDGC